MSSGPDLFVVCKNCGSEVSPYITECPYCGTRLRKRAPKLESGGVPKAEKASARARGSGGCAPGRSPASAATGARTSRSRSLLAAVIVTLGARAGRSDVSRLVLGGPLERRRLADVTTTFVYSDDGLRGRVALGRDLPLRLAARAPARHVGAAARLLRRRGLRGTGSVVVLEPDDARARRRTAAALALLAAWTVRDLLGRRRGARRRRRPARRPRDRDAARPAAAGGDEAQRARRARRRPSRACCSACSSPASASARRRATRPGSPATRRPIDQPSISACALGRDGHEQAAGGHRVAHEPAPRLGHVRRPGRERVSASARLRREPPASALVAGEQLEHAVDGRHGARRRPAAASPLASRELVQVAEQAEAGDVGERVRAGRAAPARPRGR